ncbi:MAG TPA: hypothetical protein VGV36_06605, partial [Solirubrobacteraceae bacterium]|nr:hypothetical protein [Solirubrobacteraceae bacterium]
AYIHPRTFDSTGVGMPPGMFATFLVAFVGMTLLFVTLWKYEMAAKHTTFRLRALRRALGDDDDLSPVRRSAAPQSL